MLGCWASHGDNPDASQCAAFAEKLKVCMNDSVSPSIIATELTSYRPNLSRRTTRLIIIWHDSENYSEVMPLSYGDDGPYEQHDDMQVTIDSRSATKWSQQIDALNQGEVYQS